MNNIDQELAYWDKAAEDPQVATKYIADVDLEECLEAIVKSLLVGSILEIGCGIGRLTTAIAERSPACQLHGIDISSKMLDLAPKSSVKYKSSDGRSIPYPDESFESVYSMLVFQHIDDAAMLGYIKEAYRVLKDNGVFRFQFVEGDHNGFVDHNHQLTEVRHWLQDAGFAIATIDKGLVHPQWTWITGVKQ
jgi:ubiquinone/menaquinone biosynthesis C-methylase UbiE